MYAEVGILDELRFAPFARFDAVVRFDVAIDCGKRKLRKRTECAYSHAPSRTLKPISSQSAWMSAMRLRLGVLSQYSYQWCLQVVEERALWGFYGGKVYVKPSSRQSMKVRDKRNDKKVEGCQTKLLWYLTDLYLDMSEVGPREDAYKRVF